MFFLLFLFICIVILVIWITLSVILSSNIVYYTKNKISAFITFPFSAFLILFIASFFTFGWGWFVPYAMQPSYYEVKKICELNNLPNNEEKYNKVLAYFGKSLDTLDWEELNKNKFKLNENYGSYVPNIIEYRVTVLKQENEKYRYAVTLYANQKGFSKENITFIQTYANFFHTGRYHLKKRSVASYELEWREDEFDCYDLGTMYNIPSFFKNKGLNDDK